jgi:hypothetical protein
MNTENISYTKLSFQCHLTVAMFHAQDDMNTENIQNDPLHPTDPPLTMPVAHQGHRSSANEFSDDEDQFILMTPTATQSEIVASQTLVIHLDSRKSC